eukprot:jgi/Chrzof1/4687/Cz14g22240.t1
MGATDVIITTKVDLGEPDANTPDSGQLQVTVELSSCASPEYKGRGGEDWGIELAKALDTSLRGGPDSSGLDLRSLSIVSGKTCWMLFIDCLVLNDDGSVLDALSLAARAALAVTRLPKVDVSMGEEGDVPEVEVSDDRGSTPLNISGVPVMVTVSQVGHRSVVDLSAVEEPCSPASLHIAVAPNGHICGVTKEGYRGIDPSLVQEMLEMAMRTGPKVIHDLDVYVQAVHPPGS